MIGIINPYRFEEKVDLLTGLISAYDFNELPTDYTLIDNEGSNDFPFSGLPTVYPTQGETGVMSYSYLFDGTDDYIKRSSADNNLTPVTNHSVSVWVKRAGAGSSATGYIISRWNLLVNDPFYYMSLNDSDVLIFSYADNTITVKEISYSPGSDIWTGNWKHIVYTRSGTTMKLYVNGSLVSTDTGGNGSANQTSSTYCDTFGVSYISGSKAGYFNGYIDQTAIWSIALSQSQITELYNNGIGLVYTNWV